MPTSRMARAVASGGRSMGMPQASSRSALPHWLEIERLPCLATCTPAPATTKAATVEMLNVLAPSPPVPQVSSRVWPARPASMGTAICRMARAKPTNSSTVSPFILRAIRKAAMRAFLDGLALHFEGDQEGGDARLAGLAAQNNPHGGFGVGGRKIVCRNETDQVRQKGHDKIGFLLG